MEIKVRQPCLRNIMGIADLTLDNMDKLSNFLTFSLSRLAASVTSLALSKQHLKLIVLARYFPVALKHLNNTR